MPPRAIRVYGVKSRAPYEGAFTLRLRYVPPPTWFATDVEAASPPYATLPRASAAR